jgi:hypothetical protein
MKTIRNVMVAALLWMATSAVLPTKVEAYCIPQYLDQQDWTGGCAPGGSDACNYFRSECDYYCFSHYSGGLCWDELAYCVESNHGDEQWPEYCLDQGWCNCDYAYY